MISTTSDSSSTLELVLGASGNNVIQETAIIQLYVHVTVDLKYCLGDSWAGLFLVSPKIIPEKKTNS